MTTCSVAHAFTFEAKDPAGAGALGKRELHPTGDGGYLDLGAEHGFIDGDGQFQDDIVPGPCELRVWPNLDLDEGVSGLAAAEARRALALEPQHLPVRHALRHREVKHPAIWQGHPLFGAGGGLQEIKLKGVAHIAAAGGERGIGLRPASAHAAKEVGKDVAQAKVLARPRAAAAAEGVRPPCMRAMEAPPRFTAGVDLAAIVLLSLHGVADDIVSRG